MATDDAAAQAKKAKDALGVVLSNVDKDLAAQIVLAGVSLSYQKVIDVATACSDLMYLREMTLAMQTVDEKGKTSMGYSLEEIKEHLKRHGYIL